MDGYIDNFINIGVYYGPLGYKINTNYNNLSIFVTSRIEYVCL